MLDRAFSARKNSRFLQWKHSYFRLLLHKNRSFTDELRFKYMEKIILLYQLIRIYFKIYPQPSSVGGVFEAAQRIGFFKGNEISGILKTLSLVKKAQNLCCQISGARGKKVEPDADEIAERLLFKNKEFFWADLDERQKIIDLHISRMQALMHHGNIRMKLFLWGYRFKIRIEQMFVSIFSAFKIEILIRNFNGK